MDDQITIDKKTAELISDFLLRHGHEWSRFFDARANKARVFDIRYAASEKAIRAWHETIELLTPEEEHSNENPRSRQ